MVLKHLLPTLVECVTRDAKELRELRQVRGRARSGGPDMRAFYERLAPRLEELEGVETQLGDARRRVETQMRQLLIDGALSSWAVRGEGTEQQIPVRAWRSDAGGRGFGDCHIKWEEDGRPFSGLIVLRNADVRRSFGLDRPSWSALGTGDTSRALPEGALPDWANEIVTGDAREKQRPGADDTGDDTRSIVPETTQKIRELYDTTKAVAAKFHLKTNWMEITQRTPDAIAPTIRKDWEFLKLIYSNIPRAAVEAIRSEVYPKDRLSTRGRPRGIRNSPNVDIASKKSKSGEFRRGNSRGISD